MRSVQPVEPMPEADSDLLLLAGKERVHERLVCLVAQGKIAASKAACVYAAYRQAEEKKQAT